MHQMELEPEMEPSIPSAGLQGSYVFKFLADLLPLTSTLATLLLPEGDCSGQMVPLVLDYLHHKCSRDQMTMIAVGS